MIQESLINCANERLRSRIFSHCENILSFCLSASHPVVELGFAEIASTFQTIRTSSLTMLALVWSSGRFLTAKTHILFLVELAIAEMACVSRNIRGTFHVPSGVPVQRSISGRDCSHPLKKSLKRLLQTLRVVESYPFTKFDKIPLINFADFSSL